MQEFYDIKKGITRAVKNDEEHNEEMSKTPEKKEDNSTRLRSNRIRKVPARYLD